MHPDEEAGDDPFLPRGQMDRVEASQVPRRRRPGAECRRPAILFAICAATAAIAATIAWATTSTTPARVASAITLTASDVRSATHEEVILPHHLLKRAGSIFRSACPFPVTGGVAAVAGYDATNTTSQVWVVISTVLVRPSVADVTADMATLHTRAFPECDITASAGATEQARRVPIVLPGASATIGWLVSLSGAGGSLFFDISVFTLGRDEAYLLTEGGANPFPSQWTHHLLHDMLARAAAQPH